MRDMRDMIKKLVPYIGLGVVLGVILLLVPMIIRGFFAMLLLLMKNPLEFGVGTTILLLCMYIGEKIIQNKPLNK
jgi:hypothetical protein